MAHLLDLPEEVVESSILPHLSWNDLLRCRRVCSYIKTISDAFIRLNPGMAPEIEINEESHDKSLKAFVKLGMPTTKLFVRNPSGHEFFDNMDNYTLDKFVESYGPVIKSLRMEQISIWPCFNEWTFLTSLSSLSTVEAGFIGYGVMGKMNDILNLQKHDLRAQSDTRTNGLYFPESFNETLEVIKIGNVPILDCKIRNVQNRARTVMSNCQKLNYLSFPVKLNYHVGSPGAELYQPRDVLVRMMTDFTNAIVTRRQDGRKHVKYIDFENYHVNWTYQVDFMNSLASPNFLALCKTALEFDVKLMNVQPAWLSARHTQRDRVLRSADIGNPIVSLIDLEPCVMQLNMPNLEKIDIRQTSYSAKCMEGVEQRLEWPSLKILTINVDLRSNGPPEQEEFHLLLAFFFYDMKRHQLTELTISYESTTGVYVAPNTDYIADSCPNLKKLKLSNWPGTNKALTKLWNGLPLLEQVTLEHCAGLGNVAFVGKDVGNPVFFKLKNLKKLTLRGLDHMPKITDTLFSLVLAKMKLTHLVLTSEKPLTKLTQIGINALLNGTEFSKSIERFPFYGWSMTDLSVQEFQELGKRFRSFQMV